MRMAINTPEDSTVNEQFIKLVEEIPILWNLHLPHYRNRELKDQKWAEIGAQFNLSGIEAYKKFVSLREKYKREQKLRESKGLPQTECWRLYDKLKFLDTVSFSRDRRWSKPKMIIQHRPSGSFPMVAFTKREFESLIKSEYNHPNSTPTSPSYQMSGEPSENESSGAGEPFQDNSDFYNDSMTHGGTSEGADGTEYEEHIESIPDIVPDTQSHGGPSQQSQQQQQQQQQFLNRLEVKTNAILDEHNRRKEESWARCKTLGERVAQTMFALEENDPDLALRFDIIMSEAISSIKKDQLQRLMNRQQLQGEEHRRQMELQIRLQQQQQQQGDRNQEAS